MTDYKVPELTLYIIRHGEKIPDGSRLTDTGRKQAELLGKRMQNKSITKIISSDIPRCKETAAIISKFVTAPIMYEPALREVDTVVMLQPQTYTKEITTVRTFWESLDDQKGKFLIISSGNVNRIMFSFLLGINVGYYRFVQTPTGLTKIEFEYGPKTKKRFVYINNTCHLPDGLRKRQLI